MAYKHHWTVGQEVQYFSVTNKQWYDTVIQVIHTDGTVEAKIKLGQRMDLKDQSSKLRVPIEFVDEDNIVHRIEGYEDRKVNGLQWCMRQSGTKDSQKKPISALEIGEVEEGGTKICTLTGPFGCQKVITLRSPSKSETLLMLLKIGATASGVPTTSNQSSIRNSIRLQPTPEANQTTVTFQPGPIGITSCGAVVSQVMEEGQARQLGIEVGWTISKVGNQPCNSFEDETFQAAKSGSEPYQVTLLKAGTAATANSQTWKPAVGQDILYYSSTHKKWLPCKVLKLDGDNIEIDLRQGQPMPLSKILDKLRAPSIAAAHEDEGEDEQHWEIVKKSGFLCGDQSDFASEQSYEACKKLVLSDPSKYTGFCISNGAHYVRRKGAAFVNVAGWDSYLLRCIAIKYDGKLFEDQYTTNTTRFPGGLENGKGGDPHLVWKRPGRGEGLLDLGCIKLYENISPTDLHQGSVGNCSLIAAIASLCEFPLRIQKLFGKTHRGKGMYEVILFDWGTKQWRSRFIDDRFATRTDADPTPFFAKSTNEGEIYPMLIEKAVAIMNGGFDYCSAIIPDWAFGVLTGCQDVWTFSNRGQGWTGYRPIYDGTSSFEAADTIYDGAWPDGSNGMVSKSNAEFWQYMQQWDDHDFLMCGGCAANGKSDQNSNPIGLLYMHAYSLIQVKTNCAGSGKNLIQVRNPHGTGGKEPQCKWRDNDPIWKQFPKVEQECVGEYGHQEDGLFWMEQDDFFGPNGQNFNTVYLVKMDMRSEEQTRSGRRRATDDFAPPPR